MPERFARLAALALIVVLIIALPLLISLFASLQTNAPARAPTATRAIAQNTATVAPPSATWTATRAPTLTPLPSPTAGCPNPATPEPLWVDPVVSPTNQLSQRISITLGRGREISVASGAGTVTQQGTFSIAQPVVVEAPLMPNATNHLVVSGKVEYAPGCFYTLSTQIDRMGNPLVIVQTSAPNITPVAPVTALAPGTVFLKPFSQVVGLNQDAPNASDKIWLYEASADAPFQVLAQQGVFTRLLSQGAVAGDRSTLNFWTLNENVVTSPAPEPQFEALVGEPPVEFVQGTIFACEGRMPRGLILGACSEFQNLVTAQALQRAIVDSSVLYLVRFNFQTYWVSANVLKSEPP